MHNHHHSIHHSIHLGTAWEPPAPAAADGRVLWSRRFGRPGGLEPGDRVLLVFMQPAVAAEVVVNAVSLLPLPVNAGRWAQDITPLLRDRNELLVTAAASISMDGSMDDGMADGMADGGMAHGQRTRGLLPSVFGRVALEIVSANHATGGSADA
jgi:hypothetical protein